MSKQDVIRIIDALTPEAMTSKLGVTSHSIRHARHVGSFPANWFVVVSAMCRSAGVDCPLAVFNWRSPDKRAGGAARDNEGAA